MGTRWAARSLRSSGWRALVRPLSLAKAPQSPKPAKASLRHTLELSEQTLERACGARAAGLLVNDRSFGALSDVPVAWARQLAEEGQPLHALPEVLLEALCVLLPYLMGTMGWAAPIHQRWVRRPASDAPAQPRSPCQHPCRATKIDSLRSLHSCSSSLISECCLWVQAANPEAYKRTIILYHPDDEIIPYESASFHRAFLQSLGEGAPDGVRCVELSLPARRGAAHGDRDPASPHNEWLCGLPTWNVRPPPWTLGETPADAGHAGCCARRKCSR